jgi:ferredoxin
MALVARFRDLDLDIPGSGTLMERCLAAGLPVATSCGGRGACGRCVLEILEGDEALTRATARERRVLARNGLVAGNRLSCRCKAWDPQARILLRAGYW